MTKILEIFLSRSFFNCLHSLLQREFITTEDISLVKLQKSAYSKSIGRTGKKKKDSIPSPLSEWFCTLTPMLFPRFTAASTRMSRRIKKRRFGGRQSLGFWSRVIPIRSPWVFPRVYLRITLHENFFFFFLILLCSSLTAKLLNL